MSELNQAQGNPNRARLNLLIAVTGSVAAIKLPELVGRFRCQFNQQSSKSSRIGIDVRIVMTTNAGHFVNKEGLKKETNTVIYEDADEWSQWAKLSDPVLHIELRKWADILLIAPLDANTLAKMANGICDNLLTCIVRAWDVSKPLIYCPAMNVHMYEHPLTEEHLSKLDSFGYIRVDCVEKKLACGDYGMGGMAPIDLIVDSVISRL